MATALAEQADARDTIETEGSPSPPGPGRAKRESAALAELRRPIIGVTRFAMVIAAVGALAGLVPFAGLAELGGLLLAPGPVDRSAVTRLVWLIIIGLGLRGLLLGGALAVTHLADVRLQALLRRRMVDHLGRVPLGWFSANSSGQVRKAAQNDVSDMHQLIAHHSVELTAACVLPLGGLGYLFWLDWRLGLLAIGTLPVYAVAYAWMMRGYQRKMDQLNTAFGRISAAVVEFVTGIAVVKAFGRARRAHESYRRAAEEFATMYAAWVRPILRLESFSSMALSAPVVGLISALGCFWFVGEGWVTPAQAIVEVLLAMVIPTTVTVLGFGAQARRGAAAAALRIHELLDTPALPVVERPETPAGDVVELDDVRFSYPGTDTEVLRGVSVRLEPGTVTALVGPSGSGKSTLATLLPRFYDVTGGAIRLGGVDVRRIAPSELYRRVGFVLQDVQLIHGSVADNIRLGRPEASDEEVRAAAEAAQIHRAIAQLPRGYESVVGVDAQFSGGEAQRVSIARALLADTPILVLDEATAFADPESEAAIQDALSVLVAGRTLLVIAHRLSTITGADQIVLLDGGVVAERGTHPELLDADGGYARMSRTHEESAR
ncbi:ABC transporter ATP-binding protein [Pseudonocardia spinosispora]|uniref:ABC transporter ATP-binding protein n=1 Tax=Pseudonocardia spinosispora TaxID=103441 RepID=UPI00041BF56E|nr:ABC transporter ATP-binding protein [Pseudonocardia spinosispora]